MKTSNIIALLNAIYLGDTLDILVSMGYTITQIAAMMQFIAERGFIESDENSISLTEKGLDYYKQHKDHYLVKPNFIRERNEDFINSLGKDEVYIPKDIKQFGEK